MLTVGNVSLEDCDLLTWSFGCTNFSPRLWPRISAALLAITWKEHRRKEQINVRYHVGMRSQNFYGIQY